MTRYQTDQQSIHPELPVIKPKEITLREYYQENCEAWQLIQTLLEDFPDRWFTLADIIGAVGLPHTNTAYGLQELMAARVVCRETHTRPYVYQFTR